MRILKTLTQLLKQYYLIKNQHPDLLIILSWGDYYYIYNEDAMLASGILDIGTIKQYHQTEFLEFHNSILYQYLPKLVKAGLLVAFFEPMDNLIEVEINEASINPELYRDLFAD